MDTIIPSDVEDWEDEVEKELEFDLAMKLGNYVQSIVTLPDVTDGSLQPESLVGDGCSICHEPYEYQAWQLGQTVHRPVQLTCRHVFGMTCLANWASEDDFNNECPFCRSAIYSHPPFPPEDLENFAARRLVEDVTHVQGVCLHHPYFLWCSVRDAFSRWLKPMMCDLLRLNGSELSTERTMTFFEAILDVWFERRGEPAQ